MVVFDAGAFDAADGLAAVSASHVLLAAGWLQELDCGELGLLLFLGFLLFRLENLARFLVRTLLVAIFVGARAHMFTLTIFRNVVTRHRIPSKLVLRVVVGGSVIHLAIHRSFILELDLRLDTTHI